jgi:hypothetical protein
MTVGREAIREFYEQMVSEKVKFKLEEPLPTLLLGNLALTATPARGEAGARAQVVRRQPDGTWATFLDRPDFRGWPPGRVASRWEATVPGASERFLTIRVSGARQVVASADKRHACRAPGSTAGLVLRHDRMNDDHFAECQAIDLPGITPGSSHP